jgi:hypothetical protein
MILLNEFLFIERNTSRVGYGCSSTSTKSYSNSARCFKTCKFDRICQKIDENLVVRLLAESIKSVKEIVKASRVWT